MFGIIGIENKGLITIWEEKSFFICGVGFDGR